MRKTTRMLRLRAETIRALTTANLEAVAGARRRAGDPVTPECPSEYTYCPQYCSDYR